MAPKYHQYIPKSMQPFNSVLTDISIPALKNKSDCTGTQLYREAKKDIRKEHVHICVLGSAGIELIFTRSWWGWPKQPIKWAILYHGMSCSVFKWAAG